MLDGLAESQRAKSGRFIRLREAGRDVARGTPWMRHLLAHLVALACLAQAPAALGHAPPAEHGCRCDQARLLDGWCDPCSVGYIAGVEIGSHALIEALDTHGHQIDAASLECELCRQAAAESGICRRCGWGIVNDTIYGSKLTYYLALGERWDPARIECGSCRTHAQQTGWCERCRRGWTGHVAHRDSMTYEAAAREYRLLRAAIGTLDRCETCALACYFGSLCPTCHLSYRDGQPSPPPPGRSLPEASAPGRP